MASPEYRFFLKLGESGTNKQVYPIYKDNLSLDYQLEGGQQFYRAKLSGKLTFLRDDYSYILSADFDTRYILIIERSVDLGLSFSPFFIGKFAITDCEVDEDDRIVTVKPNTVDAYESLLNGLDKEFNLIELAPATVPVTYFERSLVQIYVKGDEVVSCFLGGTSWEQDADITFDNELLTNKFHFGFMYAYRDVKLTGSASPDASGTYFGELSQNKFVNGDKPNYYFVLVSRQIGPAGKEFYYELRESPSGKALFRTDPYSPLITLNEGGSEPKVEDNPDVEPLVFKPAVQGVTGELKGTAFQHDIFGRVICDIEGVPEAKPIPTDDIVADNRNYHYSVPLAKKDIIEIAYRTSSEPTQYGQKKDTGRYYLPPTDTTKYYPIARSTWSGISVWFRYDKYDWNLESKLRKQITLNDAYPIASCIKVLLKEIAPEIKHEATTEYSEFLYAAQNPVSKWHYLALMLTPKSNILVGEYDMPAKKAPIKMSDILNMLRDLFQCYWWIEDNKFRIEHISYFMRGGSYTPSEQVVQYDLTKLINIRNGLPWSYQKNTYTFDKAQMPVRYQFGWMDDATEIFNGNPIDVLSNYVTEDLVENVNVSNFSADLDYMMLNPSAMSMDGFALLQPGCYGGECTIQIMDQIIDGVRYLTQNGPLAMYNTIPKYWLYSMPAKRLRVNGNITKALGVEQRKKQDLAIPIGASIPNLIQLVKTGLGIGKVEKLTINLSSLMAKATLKYDTEHK